MNLGGEKRQANISRRYETPSRPESGSGPTTRPTCEGEHSAQDVREGGSQAWNNVKWTTWRRGYQCWNMRITTANPSFLLSLAPANLYVSRPRSLIHKLGHELTSGYPKYSRMAMLTSEKKSGPLRSHSSPSLKRNASRTRRTCACSSASCASVYTARTSSTRCASVSGIVTEKSE